MSLNVTTKDLLTNLRVRDLQEVLKFARRPYNGCRSSLIERVEGLLEDDPFDGFLDYKIKEIFLAQNQGRRRSRRGRPSQQLVNFSTLSRPGPPVYISLVDEPCESGLNLASRDVDVSASPVTMWNYNSYPYPDVQFVNLPFFDFQKEIVKPTNISYHLKKEGSVLPFYLTPQQAQQLSECLLNNGEEPQTQVQIRFGFLETTSAQEDHFPPGLEVFVNNVLLFSLVHRNSFTGKNVESVEWKRASKPIDISEKLYLSPVTPNYVRITMKPYYKPFVAAIHLTNKLNAKRLIRDLEEKQRRNAFYTKGLIRELFYNNSAGTRVSHFQVSLSFPAGTTRMKLPCRANTCNHLQCFDACKYIELNERNPLWNCPVCNKFAPYDQLQIDEYFIEVLQSSKLPASCTEIKVLNNGSWRAVGCDDTDADAPFTFKGANNEAKEEALEESEEDEVIIINEIFSHKTIMKFREDPIIHETDQPSNVILPLKKRKMQLYN